MIIHRLIKLKIPFAIIISENKFYDVYSHRYEIIIDTKGLLKIPVNNNRREINFKQVEFYENVYSYDINRLQFNKNKHLFKCVVNNTHGKVYELINNSFKEQFQKK